MPAQQPRTTEKFKLSEEEELFIGKPADFSFKKYTHLKPVPIETARLSRIGTLPLKTPNPPQKFLTRALWLNNNKLTTTANIYPFVKHVLKEPSQLGWLDFSYNHIHTIDPEILRFRNLRIVYFHSNHLKDLSEVVKLRYLSNLRCVTFHGNPIAEEQGYRNMVINFLPQIATLDFAPITNYERGMPTPSIALRMIAATSEPVFEEEIEEEERIEIIPPTKEFIPVMESVIPEGEEGTVGSSMDLLEEETVGGVPGFSQTALASPSGLIGDAPPADEGGPPPV